MNPQQLEKLKGLIHTSGILNESERAEWLALLELMNDKQLGELEKILNSGQWAVGSGQKNADSIEHIVDSDKAKIPNSKFQIPNQKPAGQSASFQPVRPHMPSLSHIMNLPKTLDGRIISLKLSQKTMGTAPVISPVKEPALAVAITSKTVKARQNFADKLKAIFAEKELPAGKPKNELSLPQHIEQPKPKMPETLEKKVPPAVPKPPAAASLPLPAKKMPVVDLPVFAPRVAPSLAKSISPTSPMVPDTAHDSHKPGLTIQEVSEKARQDTLAAIKQRISQSSVISEATHLKPVNEKPVELHWPKDLTLVSLSSFRNSSLENFVKAIRHLIEKFGYYDVIFNLEKSPLYEVYIKTGIELMNKQQTFETFDPGQTMDSFLNREDFEKFTDLLRMIAGS